MGKSRRRNNQQHEDRELRRRQVLATEHLVKEMAESNRLKRLELEKDDAGSWINSDGRKEDRDVIWPKRKLSTEEFMAEFAGCMTEEDILDEYL